MMQKIDQVHYKSLEVGFNPCQWVDIFSLRHCCSDFRPGEILSLIQEIGATVSVMDREWTYLEKLYCVFEGYSAVEKEGTRFQVDFNYVDNGEEEIRTGAESDNHSWFRQIFLWLDRLLSPTSMVPCKINSRQAKTRDSHQEEKIKLFIEERGGFKMVDEALERELVRTRVFCERVTC